MTNGTRWARLILAGALATALAGVIASPLSAQSAPSFPAPLVAAMLSPDQPAALAVRSVFLEPGAAGADPTIVVQFAGPYTLPAEGYRLSVLFGDPQGEAVRASLRSVQGAPIGSLEAGTPDAFTELGPIDATTTADGTARLTVPLDALPTSGSMWVVAEVADPASSYTSPLYPLTQFLGAGPEGALTASDVAWMPSADGAPATVVGLPAPPELTVEGTTVRLTYSEPAPTEVGGVLLSSMVDVVRIAPNYLDAGQAPYLVAVDHIAGSVNLLDGTQLIPATLTSVNDEWLVADLPEQVVDGSVVEFDLEEVADEFDITTSVDTMALGAARSVTLEGGSVVRADGVQGTLEWFGSTGVADPAPADGATAAGDDASATSDVPWMIVIGVAVAVIALSIIALLWKRGTRHRAARRPETNDHLLDSAGPLTLGRRLAPGEKVEPGLDLRRPSVGAGRAGPSLEPLFGPDALVAPDQPIEVPDLALFGEPAASPTESAASPTESAASPTESAASPPQRPVVPRAVTTDDTDELTRALFDAE